MVSSIKQLTKIEAMQRTSFRDMNCAVAQCLDVSPATLQDLNPSLLRLSTPKDQAFELHLPAGTREKYLAAGFNDYVAKPILDMNILFQTIQRWVPGT